MSLSSSSEPSTATINDNIYDVIIVGAGNAGFSAASTAAETLRSQFPNTITDRKPRVLLLEKASHDSAGGNTFYTAGAYRFCFDGLDDLRPILSYKGERGIPDDLADRIEMAPYTEASFHADMDRVTHGKADPQLSKVLVAKSREAVNWMAENGGRWELSFHRQAYEVDGKFKFWGGLVVCFADGGKGLVKWHEELAERNGVEVRYESGVTNLIVDDDDGSSVVGVEVSSNGQTQRLVARGGVILATGGFSANTKLRTEWLGAPWSAAHVRGSATNTGDGHTMTLLSSDRRVCAKRAGHYSGCHSVCWDADSPASGGDRVLTNQYTKSGYPLGIMVNAEGKRFVDEGKDLRNYTYAIFGREVLKQPNGVAWQVWDADGASFLRKEEYDASVTDLIKADTIEDLASKLSSSGLKDTNAFLKTVKEFNEACGAFKRENPSVAFDPASKDGLSTQSSTTNLQLPKSNWARPISNPPFTAVKVTCGVTFTFGGLAVVPETAEVIAEDGSVTRNGHDSNSGSNSSNNTNAGDNTDNPHDQPRSKDIPIKGLYCCGELLGGLFWDNYPGGSGLTAGTVFGRIAGRHAAERAMKRS